MAMKKMKMMTMDMKTTNTPKAMRESMIQMRKSSQVMKRFIIQN